VLLGGAAMASGLACTQRLSTDPADVSPRETPPVSVPSASALPVHLPPLPDVVEVSSVDVVRAGQIVAASVVAMVSCGMRTLTGKASDAEAWSSMFAPTDWIGIKVNPVGYPKVFSQFETVDAIVGGLQSAGVPLSQIVVFDRYKDYLEAVGYAQRLPTGVQFASVSAGYTNDQTGIEGYDPDAYVDLPRVHPGDDAQDPSKRRSHLCNLVSRHLTKVINVPNLKDHTSAGITMALKNMTYGLVNNVARTHASPDGNWTRDFIPAVAALPALRSKVVLHIADALIGCYDGGPSPDHPNFSTFDYGALLFSRDPVAIDRIGLAILDAERTRCGLPKLAHSGKKLDDRGFEAFDERQPDHIFACAAAGLGNADLASIRHVKRVLAAV
jgi:hypothetical protein